MADTASAQPPSQVLDCIGLYCPTPILNTKQAIDNLAVGDVLEVWADDQAAEEDIKAWAKRAEQKLISIEKTDEGMKFLIQKQK